MVKKFWGFIRNIFTKLSNSKIIGLGLSLLSLIYPIILIVLSWSELKQVKHINLSLLLVSAGLYIISSVIQLLNWVLILKKNIKYFLIDAKIYFLTILMQWMPGGFWQWVGRVNLYNQSTDFSSNKTINASIFERVSLIASGTISFLLFSTNYWLGILAIFLTYTIFFYWRKENYDDYWKKIAFPLLHISTYILCWIIGGIILANIIKSVDLTVTYSISKAIYVWSITGIVTLVFFFIPGGLGIREISLTTLLMPELSFTQAILVALILRVFFMMMDIVLGTSGVLLFRIRLPK